MVVVDVDNATGAEEDIAVVAALDGATDAVEMPKLKFCGVTEEVGGIVLGAVAAGADVVGATVKAGVPSERPPVVAAAVVEVAVAREKPPTAEGVVVVLPKLKPPVVGAGTVVPEEVDAAAEAVAAAAPGPPNEKPLAVPRPRVSDAVVVVTVDAGAGAPNEVGLAGVGAIVIEAGAADAGAPRPPNEKLLPPAA